MGARTLRFSRSCLSRCSRRLTHRERRASAGPPVCVPDAVSPPGKGPAGAKALPAGFILAAPPSPGVRAPANARWVNGSALLSVHDHFARPRSRPLLLLTPVAPLFRGAGRRGEAVWAEGKRASRTPGRPSQRLFQAHARLTLEAPNKEHPGCFRRVLGAVSWS